MILFHVDVKVVWTTVAYLDRYYVEVKMCG